MGKKDGKSSGDIEEGTDHSQLNEIDHDSLCFSDAEARSSRSPYGSNGNCRGVSAQEIDGFQEPSGKSVVSESSLGNDLENGVSEVKINVDRVEQDCRICHLSLEKAAPESGVPIELGCSCKDDLAAAHKQCAETWFKIKGNKICEICGSTARNVADLVESEPTEQWVRLILLQLHLLPHHRRLGVFGRGTVFLNSSSHVWCLPLSSPGSSISMFQGEYGRFARERERERKSKHLPLLLSRAYKHFQ
ncbi:unnamed protein product [Musa textilis]